MTHVKLDAWVEERGRQMTGKLIVVRKVSLFVTSKLVGRYVAEFKSQDFTSGSLEPPFYNPQQCQKPRVSARFPKTVQVGLRLNRGRYPIGEGGYGSESGLLARVHGLMVQDTHRTLNGI